MQTSKSYRVSHFIIIHYHIEMSIIVNCTSGLCQSIYLSSVLIYATGAQVGANINAVVFLMNPFSSTLQ
jgi:hypothetical protein